MFGKEVILIRYFVNTLPSSPGKGFPTNFLSFDFFPREEIEPLFELQTLTVPLLS